MGAPNAESGQPGVERAGAVYKCPAETPGSCELIPFDTKGKKERSWKILLGWGLRVGKVHVESNLGKVIKSKDYRDGILLSMTQGGLGRAVNARMSFQSVLPKTTMQA